jgi:uncharacterized SAM-binding protein YcdF (DUF218 family)
MIARAVALLARPLTAGVALDGEVVLARRDAIVVLGAPLTDDRVGPVVAERVAIAVALWRAGAGARVIATGGRNRGARVTEADAIAEALQVAGVPSAAIAVEDAARSTADNARLVRALAPTVHTVWLATQRFHSRRATRCFTRVGFDARVAYPRRGLEDDPLRALRFTAREYAAWLRALALG